jgi:hypothetical protein
MLDLGPKSREHTQFAWSNLKIKCVRMTSTMTVLHMDRVIAWMLFTLEVRSCQSHQQNTVAFEPVQINSKLQIDVLLILPALGKFILIEEKIIVLQRIFMRHKATMQDTLNDITLVEFRFQCNESDVETYDYLLASWLEF